MDQTFQRPNWQDFIKVKGAVLSHLKGKFCFNLQLYFRVLRLNQFIAKEKQLNAVFNDS